MGWLPDIETVPITMASTNGRTSAREECSNEPTYIRGHNTLITINHTLADPLPAGITLE